MDNLIRLGTRSIGPGKPAFIIAEAGVNHNGELGMAKRLVDEAVAAGADAVKFQTFIAEDIVTKDVQKVAYQKELTDANETQRQMLKRLELSRNAHVQLKKHCDEKGILFCSTPHSSTKDVDLLEQVGVPFYKIGSGDLTNLPFLEYVAKTGKPMIISTGMADLNEVQEAVQAIRKAGNDKIVVLQCTTNYPARPEQVNLKAMLTIQKSCNTLAGYSDHTTGIEASILAVALGAAVIEKHFTLGKNLPGPDHKASLEPEDLRKLVRAIRMAENGKYAPDEVLLATSKLVGYPLTTNARVLFGSGVKEPFISELEIAKAVRKSIVAAADIPVGTVIQKQHLAIKRPGTGLVPKEYWRLLGMVTTKSMKQDELFRHQDVKVAFPNSGK